MMKGTIRWAAVALVAVSFGWLTFSSPKRAECQTDTVKTEGMKSFGEGGMTATTQPPKPPPVKAPEAKEEDMGCGC